MIDHHKYRTANYLGRPTSIKQVATLLGTELTVFEQLISANDEGYYAGMWKIAKELGLGEKEAVNMMKEVRSLEDMAQGIAPALVRQCRRAIRDGFPYDSRLMVIQVEDLQMQTKVVDLLYEAGRYRNMVHHNTVIISKADGGRVVVFCGAEVRDSLDEIYQAKAAQIGLKDVWIGGNHSHGFFGIQFSTTMAAATRAAIAEDVIHWLEDTVLGYRRMIDAQHIVSTEEFSETVHIHEITGHPEEFHKAISAAKDNNPYGAFVHRYEVEEYTEKRLFLV